MKVAPALLLLDIYLPDADRLTLMRGLQASGAVMPDVLVITAAQDVDTARSAIRAGVVYYLVKPFTFHPAARTAARLSPPA